jgi:inhibitor of KinA sporulation pathway (predicted exonuclease)
MSKAILVVDLEGTCIEGVHAAKDAESEVIEIGAVVVQDGRLAESFGRLVRPVVRPILSDFCKKLTGIAQEQANQAQEFPVVWDKFLNWTSRFGPHVWTSWGSYDLMALDRDTQRIGAKVPWVYKDLAAVFVRHTRRRANHRRAMKILGLCPEGAHHRGESDARNVAAVYLEMQRRAWLDWKID